MLTRSCLRLCVHGCASSEDFTREDSMTAAVDGPRDEDFRCGFRCRSLLGFLVGEQDGAT